MTVLKLHTQPLPGLQRECVSMWGNSEPPRRAFPARPLPSLPLHQNRSSLLCLPASAFLFTRSSKNARIGNACVIASTCIRTKPGRLLCDTDAKLALKRVSLATAAMVVFSLVKVTSRCGRTRQQTVNTAGSGVEGVWKG